MKLLSICRSDLLLNYSSLTAAKSGIVSLFLQYASWIELLLGGCPFIVLRSRGINQIYILVNVDNSINIIKYMYMYVHY